MRIALFVPCYVDQLFPHVAIAALGVLERLGVALDVPDGAVCCGQPPANAGFERAGEPALAAFVRTFAAYERVVVLSGSCAMHVRSHAASLGADFDFINAHGVLHHLADPVLGLRALRGVLRLEGVIAVMVYAPYGRAGVLATPSEIQRPGVDKVRALLGTVRGLTLAEPSRRDECCGFGGTFAVAEPELSAKIGRDRLRDYASAGAESIVSTDMSCLLHLGGLTTRQGTTMPMLHVAEVLARRLTTEDTEGHRGRQ